jgi:hypothetical protein
MTTADAEFEAAALKVLDEYMLAFNASDTAAVRASMHFPHVRLASGTVTVFQKPEDFSLERFERSMAGSGWHHSRWGQRRIIHAGAEKVHVDVRFSRLRADATLIGSYRSIYIVVKLSGRWGIQARSSFAG